MQAVEHDDAVIRHGKRLLRNGCGNLPLLYPVKRILVRIHGDQHFVVYLVPVEYVRDFRTWEAHQANEALGRRFTLEDFFGSIERNARIALHIDHPDNLYLRVLGEYILVTLQSLVEIDLARHGVDHNITLAMQALSEDASTHQPSLIV